MVKLSQSIPLSWFAVADVFFACTDTCKTNTLPDNNNHDNDDFNNYSGRVNNGDQSDDNNLNIKC